jgi:SsrA-binding protein
VNAKEVKERAGDATVARNRQATHHYEIVETYEAGLVLKGTEVKSLRDGKANLKESFARIEREEAWLIGCHISPYSHGHRDNPDPLRRRKLLLHRAELNRLMGKTQERGLTLVPLRIYFKNGRAKIEIGLAKGKKLHDKRRTIKEREARREMDKAIRARARSG